MKYASQHCCDKPMDGKMALYRECFFPNYTKPWWTKLFSYISGEAIAPITSWIRPCICDMFHVIYITPVTWVSWHSLFNCTYCICSMQQTMPKYIHPNTVVKIKNKSFSALAWHTLYWYEVGALEYTRFPQCTIKAHQWNAFFCQNLNQLLINSHKLKHEVARNSSLILYEFSMKQ